MTKLILTTLLSCIILGLSLGQKNVDIRWNEKYSEAFTNFIVSENDNYLYTFSSTKKSFFIEKYNKKELFLEEQIPIKFPNEGDAKLEFFISHKDFISIFYSIWSKTEETFLLYAFKVNLSGEIVGEEKEIVAVNIPKKYSKGLFRYVQSAKDPSTYFVYHSYLDYTFDSQVINFALINDNTDIIAQGQKDFRKDSRVNGHHFLGCYIDNLNNVYFSSRKEYNEDKKWYASHLLKYIINEKTLKFQKKYSLKNETESIEYPVVYFGEENQIIFAAIRKVESKKIVSEEENNYLSKGLIWMKIDVPNNQIISTKNTEFTQGQISSLEYEFQDGLSVHYEGIEILKTKDGYYFIAEERLGMYSETEYYDFRGKNNITTSSTSYEYRDILVCKIENEGNIGWLSNVKKTQGFVSPSSMDWYYDKYKFQPIVFQAKGLGFSLQKNIRTYLSYTVLEKDEKLYFLFNDGMANFKGQGENNYIQFGFSYGIPTYAIIEKKGKATKHLMYDKPQAKIKMRAGLVYQTKEKDYIIFSDKGKINRLGKILFK